MREVQVPLNDILEIVNCAYSYGFGRDILLYTLAEWAGDVTDKEIKDYAEWFISKEAKDKGYTPEDYDEAIEILSEWRARYITAKKIKGTSPDEEV